MTTSASVIKLSNCSGQVCLGTEYDEAGGFQMLVETVECFSQELLRHADIRTTTNIYTKAGPTALREANSKVVRLVLPAQVA